MPKNSLNVSLKGADDIFSTEESRQEQQREQVQQIPIGELFPFKNHPFKVLEELFQVFNLSRPQDFEGHSLSVSDVIALKRNGKVSVHYVDSIGFKDLQGFLDKQPERPSVLMNLKEKCDAPECNPIVCRKVRAEHEL